MPDSWEQRTLLFCGHLVECGYKSAMLKSYVSAIKSILMSDDYAWDDTKILLGAVTRACKRNNDIVKTRLPIHISLLELMLFELERMWQGKQIYLESLYKTIICFGHYRLLRVGEMAQSPHVLKAKDVHIGVNKENILIVLHSSKTHSKGDAPQEIKLVSQRQDKLQLQRIRCNRHFCPFAVAQNYLALRGNFTKPEEQFFVFSDKSPVVPENIRKVIKTLIAQLNLDASLYYSHSLHVGKASDMAKYRYSIEEIKRAGRWKSNAVYQYIK